MKHLIILCTLVVTAATLGAETVGFRGNGNGVCTDSTTIPVGFTEDQGVKWKVSLPSIGHASPICIDGKVLVVCDGGHQLQTPTLLCYDADSGKELWRGAIDVIDTLPAGIQKEARQRRAAEWERLRRWGALAHKAREHGVPRKGYAAGSVEAGIPIKSQGTRGLGGYKPERNKHGPQQDQKFIDNYHWLREQQVLFYDHWWYWYTKVFPTPVSDGEHVWVATSLDTAACFDLDTGKRRWITRFVDDPEKWAREREPSAGVASPTLIGGNFIHKREHGKHEGSDLYAMDAATGRLRWHTRLPASKRPLSSLLPMQLGGEDHVIDSSGLLVRVSDGKLLHRVADPYTEEKYRDQLTGIATGAVIDDILVVPMSDTGGGSRTDQGLRCFRLQIGGDEVRSEGLWGDIHKAQCGSIVALGDRVYARASKEQSGKAPLLEIGLRTGKVLASDNIDPSASTQIGLMATERFLVATSILEPHRRDKSGHHGARFYVYAIPGLKKVGTGELRLAADGSEDERWTSLWGGSRRWGFAHPFPYKNRLYIRSNEALYCVGK